MTCLSCSLARVWAAGACSLLWMPAGRALGGVKARSPARGARVRLVFGGRAGCRVCVAANVVSVRSKGEKDVLLVGHR